jgi:predicted component of type VI protein secretion system
MSSVNVIRLRLLLNGRPINSYAFNKDVVTVGRDPGCDISLDNPGISRVHLKLERTPTGAYRLVDLDSANGTFLNEQRVTACYVKNNDIVQFGKFMLWIGVEADRRGQAAAAGARPATDVDQATTVLSSAELQRVLDKSRESEKAVAAESTDRPLGAPLAVVPTGPGHAQLGPGAVFLMILLGTVVGAGAAWLLLHR